MGEGKENGEKMIKKVKEEGKHHLHFFFFLGISLYLQFCFLHEPLFSAGPQRGRRGEKEDRLNAIQ